MEREKDTRLCLIDGTFELFRAFFGAPGYQSDFGMEVGATRAFARSLMALVKADSFTHFAVAFDTVIESFRNQLFEGYKTGDGIEPALLAQFPLAEEVSEALGFAVLRMVDFEADDGLATIALEQRLRPGLREIVIASPDKDLRQCVDDGRNKEGGEGCPIVTWDRIRDLRYDEEAVVAKMGVRPVSVPDFLALVGDSADGIPGIPRWGARSAARVLSRYLHIERIPRDPAQWAVKVRGAASLVSQLKEHESEVQLYKRLATLRTDVGHGFEWEQLEHPGIDSARKTRAEHVVAQARLAGS